MLNWLKRIFGESEEAKRQRFFQMVDALNAATNRGPPTTVERRAGTLKLRSGVLAFGDPQYVPSLEIPNIDAEEAIFSASLWQYPSGGATVVALQIELGDLSACDPPRVVGAVGIDSAALVVADKADISEHWTETGKDRIGVITTAPDDKLLRELQRRFKLKTVQVNSIRAEVVGRISESLEREINAYLQSVPEYAQFPFMHFHVETNNSFDRVNYFKEPWGFLPVGNDDLPLMFVCSTGRGDGRYDVQCQFAGDVPKIVSISFIDDDSRAAAAE